MLGGRRLGTVPAYAVVAVAAVGCVVLRLPFVHGVLYTDEGGLLVVARQWHAHGPYLYGDVFVDRPPLLLLFFRAAADLGGLVPLRLLGLVLVALTVVAAGVAGDLLGGRRGATCAALVTAALLADPRLGTLEVDAETVGIPFVVLAATLALSAVRLTPGRRRLLLLLGAGAAGMCALLVKQNLAGGLVFALVLVAATGMAGRSGRRTAGEVGVVLAGAAVPLAAAVGWCGVAATGPGGLWYSSYGFRLASSNSLFGETSSTQMARLHELLSASLWSGLAVLVLVSAAQLLRRGRPDPVALALLAMLVVEVVGVAGGGYYWTHYLIGLVPATALLTARAAGAATRPLLLGGLVAATLLSSVLETAQVAADLTPAERTEVGALTSWFERVQQPGDSAVVLYGEASLFETTRLRPAYPYLWTLPQRVLDPHLTLLVRTLDASSGPTFVVVRSDLDSWGLDPRGRVGRALARHYRLAAHVAGDTIYLRRGTVGQKAP